MLRLGLLLLTFGLLLVESGSLAKPVTETEASSLTVVPSTEKTRVDFDTQVKPIFESKCMPCHFNGGKMYSSLPFDKPATIRQLGTKVFTRIKEENDRQMIEAFLKQSP
jgi:hypothetical protein